MGLSGGQQQRLCIARAIAVEPQVLLMDEPCSALDPISTSAIEDLIHELKSEYTIVIVTHNTEAYISGRCRLTSDERTPHRRHARGPRDHSRGPLVVWSSGHLKVTFTCSSLPPSRVFVTVSTVPEPATLVDANGFAADQ